MFIMFIGVQYLTLAKFLKLSDKKNVLCRKRFMCEISYKLSLIIFQQGSSENQDILDSVLTYNGMKFLTILVIPRHIIALSLHAYTIYR